MTSIKTYCKTVQSSCPTNLLKLSNNEILHPQADTPYTFTEIFNDKTSQEETFVKLYEELLKYFLAGYNTCLLLSGHFKDYQEFITGEKGFLTRLIEQISKELTRRSKGKEAKKLSTSSRKTQGGIQKKDEVHMKIYDVYNSKLKDLLLNSNASSVVSDASIHLFDDDFDGMIVRNADKQGLTEASLVQSLHVLQSSIQKTGIGSTTDKAEALIVEFGLKKVLGCLEVPVTSWFRVVCSEPNVVYNTSSMISVSCNPTRSSVSFLDKILYDPLNANCVTKSMSFITLQEDDKLLLDCLKKLGKKFTYPVDNSPLVKGLLRCYRSKLKQMEDEHAKVKEVNEAYIEQLKGSHAQLKLEHSEIQKDLKETTEKLNQAVLQHTDASSKVVFSTTDKLKMTKEAIDLKLLTNSLQLDSEKQMYELRNKLLNEEENSTKLERNLAYERKLNTELKNKLECFHRDYQEMMEEYMNLKSNYDSVFSKHQQQIQVNDDLSEAVNKLSNLKNKLVVQSNTTQCTQIQDFHEQLLKLKNILDNGEEKQSLESHYSPHINIDTFKLTSSSKERGNGLSNVDKLYEDHHKDLQHLEDMLFELKRNLNDKDGIISVYKNKFASLTTKMLLQSDEKEVLVSRLHEANKLLTKLSCDYKTRLEQYITDISNFFASSATDVAIDNNSLTTQVNKMLSDLKEAYKNDAMIEQKKMSEVKNLFEVVLGKHEKLLIAYRLLYQKLNKDLGEDEVREYEVLLPSDETIQAKSLKDRNELRTRLIITEEKVKELEEKAEVYRHKITSLEKGDISVTSLQQDDGDPWRNVTKQLKDFTFSVQHNLEREKAELLTRCNVAEQQLESYYDIMNDNKRKYEYELHHLRRLLHDHTAKSNLQPKHYLPYEEDKPGFLPAISQYKSYDTH